MPQKYGFLFPHPPLLIPEIGRNYLQRVANTLNGFDRALNEIKDVIFDTIVILSPHAPVGMDFIYIYADEVLSGDFANFGCPNINFKAVSDLEFLDKLLSNSGLVKFKALKREPLDHGVLVPLYFLQKMGITGKFVTGGISWKNSNFHKEVGKFIASIAKKLNKDMLFIASGDLSHCLGPGAPAGFDRRGIIFDQKISEFFKTGDLHILDTLSEDVLIHAAECGFRPIQVLIGIFDDSELDTIQYSYEGPFGVGYLVGGIKEKPKCIL